MFTMNLSTLVWAQGQKEREKKTYKISNQRIQGQTLTT
jgi:hypothetical protein